MPTLSTSAFFREAGTGMGVVCLHSNASNSSQWRDLIDLLSPSYHVFAPDSYGSGKSPDWHSDQVISLSDEVDFIEPVLAQAGNPLILIGHSYGAAVALMAALRWPERIKAMVIYEPTLFSLVDSQQRPPNDVDGIRNAVAAASAALAQNDQDAAAKHFIDFWMGAGAWSETPDQRRPSIATSVVNVRRWGHALFTERTPIEAFAKLAFPILYLLGEKSPASAHAVAQVLLPALPQAQSIVLRNKGHMGPITHPADVNAQIKIFLDGLERSA
jgi:pimeloyl-ACP methyl ester carboxylesterase